MKNVYMGVGRWAICALLPLLINSCLKRNSTILVPDYSISNVKYKKKVDLRYKGFKIGEAILINITGVYDLEITEPKVHLLRNSSIKLYPKDILKVNYEFTVDTVDYNDQVTQIDSLRYEYVELNESAEKYNELLHSLKEVFEAIPTEKEVK